MEVVIVVMYKKPIIPCYQTCIPNQTLSYGLNDFLLCNTYVEVISYWLLLNSLNFNFLIYSLEDTRDCHLCYGIFIRSIARSRGLSTLEISLSWLKYVPSSYTDLYEVIGLWPWWIWYEEIYGTDDHGRYWSRYVG